MRKSLFVVAVLAGLFVFAAWHKFYVSVSQVDYIAKDNTVQITSRLFYDDLQKALQERYDTGIKVDKTYPQDKLDGFIKRYVDQKLKVLIDGKQVNLNYLGHEDENDYVVCYIEILNVSEMNRIEIENTLLMDVFPQQKNIVHVRVGKIEKSFMLTQNNDKAVLNLSE